MRIRETTFRETAVRLVEVREANDKKLELNLFPVQDFARAIKLGLCATRAAR